jgi:hypothetical protein
MFWTQHPKPRYTYRAALHQRLRGLARSPPSVFADVWKVNMKGPKEFTIDDLRLTIEEHDPAIG